MSEAVSGLFGGCAGVLVGHPFDTVKVKLQTQDYRNPRYSGTFDCFKQTIRTNGARGLYRGIASPLAGVGGINAVIFGVQGYTNRLFSDQNALSSHFMAGMCAGFAQSFICSPVELTKTLLQIQSDKGGPAKYKGSFDCLSQIYKQNGIRGIFKGQLATILRETPAFGTYFLSFEAFSRIISGEKTSYDANSFAIFMAGGFAGMSSWFISYPVDVIKSRLQSDGAFGPAKYTGIYNCLKLSVKEEGLGVLTRGLNSAMIRAFPTNAATFVVVSYTTKLMMNCEESLEEIGNSQALKNIAHVGDKILMKTKDIHNGYKRCHDSLRHMQHESKIVKFIPSAIGWNFWNNELIHLFGGEGHDVDTYRALKGMLYNKKLVGQWV